MSGKGPGITAGAFAMCPDLTRWMNCWSTLLQVPIEIRPDVGTAHAAVYRLTEHHLSSVVAGPDRVRAMVVAAIDEQAQRLCMAATSSCARSNGVALMQYGGDNHRIVHFEIPL